MRRMCISGRGPNARTPSQPWTGGRLQGHRNRETEGEGFEPSCAFARTAFEAGPLGHLRHPSSHPSPPPWATSHPAKGNNRGARMCLRSLRDPQQRRRYECRFRSRSPVASARTSGSHPGVHMAGPAFAGYSIGVPGFEPGTSPTRTERSTGLSHTPCPCLLDTKISTATSEGWDSNPAAGAAGSPKVSPRSRFRAGARNRGGFESTGTVEKRTGWDSNPRGLSPTRFPIVRLKPLGHPSRRHQARSNECLAEAEGVGFEPTRAFRPNALAGRRF